MDSILWFARYGDSTSFSRISKHIIPLLSKVYNITVISNYKDQTNQTDQTNPKFIKIGSDTSEMSYDEFSYHLKGSGTSLDISMKYIMVQITDLIYNNNFKYIIICNGIYEANFFVTIFNNNPNTLINKQKNRTKLVVWSPIDYIPNIETIREALKTDIFFTMTPVMVSEIKKLVIENNISSDSLEDTLKVLGHGTDILQEKIQNPSRKKLIKELNKLRGTIWTGSELSVNDIIILNANNCKNTFRKKLDTTIDAFNKLLSDEPNVINHANDVKYRLWLHTDLETLFKTITNLKTMPQNLRSRLILSNSNVSDYQLSLIYQVAQIGLQTSTGEGFSLTNLEGSIYNQLQVVPDFLACSYHYQQNRGLLIPISRMSVKNEADHLITIGIVSVEDIHQKLKEAVSMVRESSKEYQEIIRNAHNYAKSLTWNSIADDLITSLV